MIKDLPHHGNNQSPQFIAFSNIFSLIFPKIYHNNGNLEVYEFLKPINEYWCRIPINFDVFQEI